MTAIKSLQRRLDRLEDRPSTEPDLVEIVLASLGDTYLKALQEASELNAAGCTAEEIPVMMAERWPRYQEAVANFQEGYQQAVDARMKF